MTEFAQRQPDGTWVPFDEEANRQVSRALESLADLPGSITVRDEDGEVHTLSFEAGQVLRLALHAMDARLRPERAYQAEADKIYTALAAGFEEGVQELRQVFELGAKRPWPVK